MTKLTAKAFTLVELLVVITIIMILTTFVSLNLTSAKKTARDNKRISDAQLLASALDQYAASNARLYLCPGGGCIADDSTSQFVEITPASTIYGSLSTYINPVPTEVLTTQGYKYFYAYRKDGRKASIIITKFETGNKLCNITNGNLPKEVSDYRDQLGTACYYVSR